MPRDSPLISVEVMKSGRWGLPSIDCPSSPDNEQAGQGLGIVNTAARQEEIAQLLVLSGFYPCRSYLDREVETDSDKSDARNERECALSIPTRVV